MDQNRPGTAPGLLLKDASAEQSSELRVMVFSFDTEQLTETEMRVADVQPPARDDTKVTWVRFLKMPEPQVLAGFGARWGLSPLYLEDVLNLGQRPKTEFRESEAFAVLQSPRRDEDGYLDSRQVSLFFGPNYVISIPEEGPPMFPEVADRRRQGGPSSRIRTLGAPYLFCALLDAAVDHAFPVIDEIDRRAEEMEYQLLTAPDDVSLDVLYQLRQDLTTLRRFQRPAVEALQRLIKHEASPLPETVESFLRDTHDHQAQLVDSIDALRESSISLKELFLAHQGHRLNDVMKVLTIISTIFIPMSFLTGLYGMNFNTEISPWNLPELNTRFGYPVLLVVLCLIVTAMVVFFRRRRWI
jgi:magnesium transporter